MSEKIIYMNKVGSGKPAMQVLLSYQKKMEQRGYTLCEAPKEEPKEGYKLVDPKDLNKSTKAEILEYAEKVLEIDTVDIKDLTKTKLIEALNSWPKKEDED